jgi:DNA-binding response OmpR family regulator
MLCREVKSRVLVVDDEHLIADTLALILNQKGFETTAVYSGEQAVEAAMAIKPQVVISDIMMGTMNGIEAAILIRDGVPGCHFLLISGHPNTSALLDNAGAHGNSFDVLAKPIHPQDLLEHIQALRLTQTNTLPLQNVQQLRGVDRFGKELKGTAVAEGVVEQVWGRCVA